MSRLPRLWTLNDPPADSIRLQQSNHLSVVCSHLSKVDFTQCHPFGVDCIISGNWNRFGCHLDGIEDGDDMTARVTLGLASYRDDSCDFSFDSTLLGQLPNHCSFGVFAIIDESTRKRPAPLPRLFASSNQQHLEAVLASSHGDRIDRQRRIPIAAVISFGHAHNTAPNDSQSVAPLALLVGVNRLVEVVSGERRPVHICEVQFGVGDLPQ